MATKDPLWQRPTSVFPGKLKGQPTSVPTHRTRFDLQVLLNAPWQEDQLAL